MEKPFISGCKNLKKTDCWLETTGKLGAGLN